MQKLFRQDLHSLEDYSAMRDEFRAQIIQHKKNRVLQVGPNITMHFEDRLVMQYQIQEMLRAEKIFESAGIQEELDAYNPMIPDGSNWKVTFMIEFPDPDERAIRLRELLGIEDATYVQVSGHDKVHPISDEDLPRETAEKTSSVHFMRFELTPEMVSELKEGAALTIGIDHPEYKHAIEALSGSMRDSLVADMD
ncbi:MAG: DUF3501 family protein [Gammaproteobacteria bacterium]|nr:MAG: DUF3501 family protein [Gammaproteobacteria bacterium]